MIKKIEPQDTIKEYYGEILKSSQDLKTSACCPIDSLPNHLKPLLAKIHPEVQNKFYGCGSPIPYSLDGKTVLDLGCGTGRDVYLLSQLVGKNGRVIGVDMTENQLEVAKKHIPYHTEAFGTQKSNVKFIHGYIEDLKTAGIEDNSIDVVVSNCVINLSPNKEQVFREIFRVLKPGGEFFFSDVFSERRIPEPISKDPVLLGECLGGALYIEDFRRLLRQVGCLDYRTTKRGSIELSDPELFNKAGMIPFFSATIRTFKCDFEDVCEDFGHVAYYKGTIPELPHEFLLDDHHVFKTGMPAPVCGNTAKMLSESRYAAHFKVEGNFSTHYGIFDCAPTTKPGTISGSTACC